MKGPEAPDRMIGPKASVRIPNLSSEGESAEEIRAFLVSNHLVSLSEAGDRKRVLEDLDYRFVYTIKDLNE